MTRNQPTIVVWHGQYSNDGQERLAAMKERERAYPGLRNLRLIGKSGDWWLVADASTFAPREGYMAVEDWHEKCKTMVTWVPPFKALPRAADDLICGAESGAEVVYADIREAEEAADRRHDFSDHLEPWEISR